jgi:multiple sugar transport system ATP-binding protein
MADIRLSGINKVYPGGTHAVHDVDLHIADGEFMIMVGPSGCAKSTILRMIAGLEVPTTGTVEIGGRIVNDVAPKDRDIAMVFQSYALYPHMTVRENMAFGLRLRRMPQGEIDQRVAEAARILGLESLLDRLPKAMSGGQRQRVAMGRAIVREPQAFLMDEPLSNLDAKLRVQMRTEIAKLHQRLQTTTVYVTHDQVEALTLGQRICILRKGIVQQVDTPFQVYTNPANVFVGGFIGSPGMNFMNGHLVLHDGVLYLRLGDQHLPVPATVSSRLLATTDMHGRGVIVGIRPEHLSLSTSVDVSAMPVQVELSESMGSEVYAYFSANVQAPDLTALSDTQATADTYVARLGAGSDAPAGAQVFLRPDLDEVHLFDPQSMLTMLAPADEAEVRSRQTGSAIVLASGRPSMQSPVTAPPATTLVQPMQPVIHLHQTIVQPDLVTTGTLAAATPGAIASVFDQPVASPITLEPMLPMAAAGGSAGGMSPGGHPRPSFARTVGAAPTSGATSPPPPPPSPASPEPAEQPEPVAEAPARPQGFAPRPIGRRTPEPLPAPPAPEATPAAEPEVRLDATPEELDAAIESLEPDVAGLQVAAPITGSISPGAPSAFRDALSRVRDRRPASVVPNLPVSTVLPPRVTLAPSSHPAGGTTGTGASEHPPMFRAPQVMPTRPEPADN